MRGTSAAVFVVALLAASTTASQRACLFAAEPSASNEPAAATFDGHVPDSIADLKAMQQRVQRVIKQVLPTTVAVQVGSAQGSGVIISPEGFVLTAAHVAGKPKQVAWLVLSDGRRVRGETLGVYRTLDAGLIHIVQPAHNGEWPHAEMGDSSKVAPGQWCLAAGHPGGIQENRPPVVRLGRILSRHSDHAIKTDCTLIGGDSGGPLFDLNGKVIGVNSRIGNPLNVNLHVPVSTFRHEWDRLAHGDWWGHAPEQQPFIGVQGKPEATDATIARVFPGTPAAATGLRPGDLVLRFAGSRVEDFAGLQALVSEQEPGQHVKIVVRRNGETLTLDLVVGDRSN